MAKVMKTGKREIESTKDEQKNKGENGTSSTPQQILTNFINLIEVEEEVSYKNIKVFPLHLKQTDLRTVKLKTLDEALKEKILEIQETDNVSQLKFINKSKTDKILIVEGDVVQGGRQNRVVNITMMLDEDTTIVVPTSCVEQGRWHGSSKNFKENYKISPTLHQNLNEHVYKNYETFGGKGMAAYASDQSKLWGGVNCFLSSSSPSSLGSSSSFSDVYITRDKDIQDYLDAIESYIKDCCGLAAVIGNKIIISITDSIELFMPTMKTTLKSYIVEALDIQKKPEHDADAVVKAINDCAENKIDLLESPNKIGQIIKLISSNVGSAFLYQSNIVNMTFVRE